MSIDVIIPCYNAAQTLERAVLSCLQQPMLNQLWLIDDGSNDQTWAVIQSLKARFPDKICAQSLPQNGGVARARNWGALQSRADFIAFLDADDAYQPNALEAPLFALKNMPALGLVRLRLQPVDLPTRYAAHPNLAAAWRVLEMTVGGNMVFRRAFFLASGGFPQDELFRQFGGEDAALGIAISQSSVVATAFSASEPGVLHFCREGMHAARLLDLHLFGQADERVRAEDIQAAEAVSARISETLQTLKPILNAPTYGITELTFERS